MEFGVGNGVGLEMLLVTVRENLRCFLNRNLPLHKAAVIESLRLKYKELDYEDEEDVRRWIVIAVSRHVRDLKISYSSDRDNAKVLPSCLYTCESLVVLKLNGDIDLDVPELACLPSLKTLKLREMVYSNEESLHRLLSICPILEHLVVKLSDGKTENMRKFTINVPSLQSLSLYIPDGIFALEEFVINTPSLKYFKLKDEWENSHSCLIENMPELREAYVDVVSELSNIQSVMRSITSVKSLTLCVRYRDLEDVYGDGLVFHHLEHLKLCVCQEFDLLVGFLRHCPNLRELDYFGLKHHHFRFESCCEEPTTVPECILSTLQIFNWSNYLGSPDERNLKLYILNNALCLKKVSISSDD